MSLKRAYQNNKQSAISTNIRVVNIVVFGECGLKKIIILENNENTVVETAAKLRFVVFQRCPLREGFYRIEYTGGKVSVAQCQ